MEDYMRNSNLSRNELAQKLDLTKESIGRIFNVSFDPKISKLVDVALSCNAMPLVFFVNVDEFIRNDAGGKGYDLVVANGTPI